MKLYTEEQVKDMLNRVMMLEHHIVEFLNKYYTPIVLPTEEEIKEYSLHYSEMQEDVSDKLGKYLVKAVHMDGAQWIINKIQGGNK